MSTAQESVLVGTLRQIASFKRGGIIQPGTADADRDEMIGLAREALRLSGLWKPGQSIYPTTSG